MRLLLFVASLSLALVVGVTGVCAAPNGTAGSLACKALRAALAGTPAGANLKVFVPGGLACTSDKGGDSGWHSLLQLGMGAGHTRAGCKVLQADQGLQFTWLAKARSGADLACAATSAGGGRFSIVVYVDKGRSSGYFSLSGPASGVVGSSVLPMVRRLTSVLPR